MRLFRKAVLRGLSEQPRRIHVREVTSWPSTVTSCSATFFTRTVFPIRSFSTPRSVSATLVECVFPDLDRELARDFCETIVRRLGSGVSARFLFLDRELSSLRCCFLGRGKWEEQAFSIPGPKEALSGRLIQRDRSQPSRAARMLETPEPEPEKHARASRAAPAREEFDHAAALRSMLDMLNRR